MRVDPVDPPTPTQQDRAEIGPPLSDAEEVPQRGLHGAGVLPSRRHEDPRSHRTRAPGT